MQQLSDRRTASGRSRGCTPAARDGGHHAREPDARGRSIDAGRSDVISWRPARHRGPILLLFLLLAGLGALPASSAPPRVLDGVPRVLDGDTIVVAGVHLRLNGIDAEEVSHPSEPYGPAARAGLQSIVGIGAPVRCVLNGDRSHERYIATCFNLRGQDIAAELIRQGLALDCARYSGGRYRRLEPREARVRLRQKPYC
jgi:micrococcal nuclease